jgi:thiamine-monophosphate kinase
VFVTGRTGTEPASEESFYNLIDRAFPREHAQLLLPRGDDCAHIKTPGELVVSTDLFIEDVHFKREYFSAGDMGHKALASNLSDIAAMGARPMGFSLGVLAPRGLDEEFWQELFQGMADLAARFELVLTGGDVSRGPVLGFSVTIWGRPGPKGRVLRRGGGGPGDSLVLIGRPGLARAGLMVLEERGLEGEADYPEAVGAHLRPEPMVSQGLVLAGMDGVRGAMDVSDGLAKDLPRFLGGLGADLTLDPLGLHPEILGFCEAKGLKPAEFAAMGGEDYALLAAVGPEIAGRLVKLEDAAVIGAIRREPGIKLNGGAFDKNGFDHFV